MTAFRLYFRDILGLALLVSAVMVMLGGIFGVLAMLNYFNHEETLASTYLHESLPLFIFLIPFYLIGKFINRPKWVSEVQKYQLEAAKKLSQ